MTCRQWLAVLLTAQILMAVQPPLAATMRELIDDAKADFEKKDYSAAIRSWCHWLRKAMSKPSAILACVSKMAMAQSVM